MFVMKYLILLQSIIVFSLLLSCEDEKITNLGPTDFVKVWMTKNLDVDHYRNGDSIPEVIDPKEWENLKTGAWCYYNNDSELGKVYGKLYNWYAVNDPRGLAPEGWHVASDIEWWELENCLGVIVAGGKLKSTGSIEDNDGLWKSPNSGATNESGFSGLPGGIRGYLGLFDNIGHNGFWWLKSEFDSVLAESRFLEYNSILITGVLFYKEDGLSVRCVKD